MIEVCKKHGELDALRDARNSAQQFTILPKEEWISWIDDEEKLYDESNKKNVLKLFENAVNLCPRVEIWLKVIEFHIKILKTNRDEVRRLFEDALEIWCLVPSEEANHLWVRYRNFEKESATNSEHGNEKIRHIWHRQLSVPNNKLEDIFSDYEVWEKGVCENNENIFFQHIKTGKQKQTEAETYFNKIKPKEDEINNVLFFSIFNTASTNIFQVQFQHAHFKYSFNTHISITVSTHTFQVQFQHIHFNTFYRFECKP